MSVGEYTGHTWSIYVIVGSFDVCKRPELTPGERVWRSGLILRCHCHVLQVHGSLRCLTELVLSNTYMYCIVLLMSLSVLELPPVGMKVPCHEVCIYVPELHASQVYVYYIIRGRSGCGHACNVNSDQL